MNIIILYLVDDIDDEYDDTARDIQNGCDQKNDSPTHRFKGIFLVMFLKIVCEDFSLLSLNCNCNILYCIIFY